MNRVAPSFIAGTSLLLAACGGDTPTRPSNFLDTTWRLASIERPGQDATTVTASDRYTVRLEASGQASVRADCNSCGGRYAVAGDTLTLGPLACTLVACAPGSLDGAFLSVLGSAPRLAQDGGSLTLTSAAGTLRFTR
jgi:heat shock protein HslJ